MTISRLLLLVCIIREFMPHPDPDNHIEPFWLSGVSVCVHFIGMRTRNLQGPSVGHPVKCPINGPDNLLRTKMTWLLCWFILVIRVRIRQNLSIYINDVDGYACQNVLADEEEVDGQTIMAIWRRWLTFPRIPEFSSRLVENSPIFFWLCVSCSLPCVTYIFCISSDLDSSGNLPPWTFCWRSK